VAPKLTKHQHQGTSGKRAANSVSSGKKRIEPVRRGVGDRNKYHTVSLRYFKCKKRKTKYARIKKIKKTFSGEPSGNRNVLYGLKMPP
jgi:hypothetical protein